MDKRRVVVTGLGMVSPLACGVEETWKRILAGKSGAAPITRFDASRVVTNYACEIPYGDGSDGTFDPDAWMEARDRRKVDDFILYGMTAATQAVEDAGIGELDEEEALRTGGMIVFDTRDADIAGFGAATPEGRKLQQLAAPLDIPPLEPVPEDHVLTRTFYLLNAFPGRYAGREVWVEAAPPDAELIEGMPFRDLNDNVTPVVIGGNDWAAAWAMDGNGNPLVPIGSGFTGERQREIAYRFGVNLIMHVLTGNYKSDQVHVPALLDRLGQ